MPSTAGKYLFMAKNYVRTKYGQEAVNKIIEKLNSDDQKIYLGAVMSTKQYPLSTYQHFLGAMADIYGSKELETYSIEIAKKMLFGFFGFIAKFLTIKKVIPKSSFMWKKAFGEGDLKCTFIDDHNITLELTNFVMHEDIDLDSKEMYNYTMSGEAFIRQIISMILGKPVRGSHKIFSRTKYEFYYKF